MAAAEAGHNGWGIRLDLRNIAMAFGISRNSPIVALFLLTWLCGCLLEPGDLGSSDAGYRLQASHSLWTDEPQIRPDDLDRTFPIGSDGQRKIPWGIGQSLVMLPADIVVSTIISPFHLSKRVESKVRQAGVGYLTFPIISATAVAVAVLLLGRIGFSSGQSLTGGLALFFCTSLFAYTQIHQENSCLLLFDLLALYGVTSWLVTRIDSYLMIAGAALGMSILTRLPSVFDLAAVTAFGLLIAIVDTKGRRGALNEFSVSFGKYAVPFVLMAVIADRTYQFLRFGTWTDTYVSRFAHQVLSINPELPPNWPWTYPFWHGVYLILLSPERSVFLFDPLLLVTVWIFARCWRHVSLRVRSLGTIGLLLLAIDVAFFARHDTPVGASTWGSRFTTSPVILLSMLAVPLSLSLRARFSRIERIAGIMIISLAIMVQPLSVVFWYQLEEAQLFDTGSGFVIGMRGVNLVAIMLGKFRDWHLATPSVEQRYLILNFCPFLVNKYVSIGIAHKLQLLWYAGVVLALTGAARLAWVSLLFDRRHGAGQRLGAIAGDVAP